MSLLKISPRPLSHFRSQNGKKKSVVKSSWSAILENWRTSVASCAGTFVVENWFQKPRSTSCLVVKGGRDIGRENPPINPYQNELPPCYKSLGGENQGMKLTAWRSVGGCCNVMYLWCRYDWSGQLHVTDVAMKINAKTNKSCPRPFSRFRDRLFGRDERVIAFPFLSVS